MKAITNFLATSGLTQSEFARRIGVTQPMVYQMSRGLRPVPEKICVVIEQETGGAITRKDLRPDDWHLIWPELIGQRTQEANHA